MSLEVVYSAGASVVVSAGASVDASAGGVAATVTRSLFRHRLQTETLPSSDLTSKTSLTQVLLQMGQVPRPLSGLLLSTLPR